MNKKARSRIAGATTLIAIMLGSAACGTATPATNIGGQLQAPGTTGPKHPNGGASADSAERRAKAEARAQKAEALRAAQGRQQHENKLGHQSMP
jgi:hypothetical protein